MSWLMTALMLSVAASWSRAFPPGCLAAAIRVSKLLTVGNLPVQCRGLCTGLSREKVDEEADNCRGAEIDCKTVISTGGIARFDLHYFRVTG